VTKRLTLDLTGTTYVGTCDNVIFGRKSTPRSVYVMADLLLSECFSKVFNEILKIVGSISTLQACSCNE